jgi:predicted transcriptional regulator
MLNDKQQFILLELLWNYSQGKKRIEQKDSLKLKCITSNNDFYRNLRQLIKFGYINHNGTSSYSLTGNGWAIANIIAMQPNTDRKYRKIAQEIMWLP